MKNQILDEPIRDSFSDFLEKGERIVWSASPRIYDPINDNLVSIRAVGLIYLWFAVSFSLELGIGWGTLVCLVIFLLMAFHTIWKNRKRSEILYAVSQKRIIFQLPYDDKKKIHQIELKDILNVVVNERTIDKDHGTIYIAAKNPNLIPFDTYNLGSGEKRHQPTFEMIRKPQEVAKLIREGIQREKNHGKKPNLR